MSEQVTRAAGEIDEELPSAARVYDYLLGGAHNFAADRELAERLLRVLPCARDLARLNRAFLRRAVVYLAGRGVRQFLDIGSGIPTVGNVHEIAQEAVPGAHVVYVDRDPVAVAHSQLLLEGDEHATIVQADMLEPETILGHAATRRLLDFSQPVGLLMTGVFHFVLPDAEAHCVLARYRDALAPGSFLALSHLTADTGAEQMAGAVEVMSHSSDPVQPRSHAEIRELFAGFDVVEPGVVGTAQWRPDRPEQAEQEPGGSRIYAGVGRKP
ncbi:SAM-dependent methyltransferase [Saccharopolyspora erythraea]|uniref:S-adenosyl methyltransferase n=2 Tax=Saccharopolyspora erythraea TaxID=1836 RepID=A4FLB1_SACEN|nr:SAM-dependent methyltransferase [Saccharopolyspora erythraea]EQD81351.1 hypothetical protein N599_36725 [Saccharopolyspora erythraea D]QRK88535.1 SAM-dependent methyltransferase [Saccharopolyspora erythraea]CAM04836.1 hypothetical protein SACE_5650 [Saccharopolyspora erythraea NRRL 2338]